ncbi:MAG: DUF2004 domain-containing protein [Deltaproteobacteria bacterium]|nr:DUF2004 domain-containing protein [Deltaproteobacteria bacterium]
MFGSLVVDHEAYVPRVATKDGRTTTPSLYVGDGLDQAALDRVATLFDPWTARDLQAREAIAEDLARGTDGVVSAFVAFHREELELDIVQRIFGAEPTDALTALAQLDLVGVSVHADETSGFSLVFDYSFGPTVTDELLAVKFSPSGVVTCVAHES